MGRLGEVNSWEGSAELTTCSSPDKVAWTVLKEPWRIASACPVVGTTARSAAGAVVEAAVADPRGTSDSALGRAGAWLLASGGDGLLVTSSATLATNWSRTPAGRTCGSWAGLLDVGPLVPV